MQLPQQNTLSLAAASSLTRWIGLGLALGMNGFQPLLAETALIQHAPSLNGGSRIEGGFQQNLGETLQLNGGVVVTEEIRLPGTPTVQFQGNFAHGAVTPGTGSTAPAGWLAKFNGNGSVAGIRTRVNPAALPVVPAPQAPTGTRSVTVTSSTTAVGSFATLRNLSLNGNVGTVAVPPGAYGNFVVNGQSTMRLGVAGATTASVYHLQSLTLSGQGKLDVVGPVIVRLNSNFSVNGQSGVQAQCGWLTVQMSSACSNFTLNGGSTFYGILQAPSAEVTLNGQARFEGGLACDRLTVNGGAVLKLNCSGNPTTNQPPVANAQSVAAVEDTAKVIVLTGTDPENSPLTYTVLTQPAHGTLSGTVPNLTYTPVLNYSGPDSFTFRVSDGQVNSSVATVSISVADVDDPPVATPASFTFPEDTPKSITLQATDVEGTALVWQITQTPSHGTLSGTAPALIYTPDTNYNGPDSFAFTAKDGLNTSAPAIVSLTITPVNDAPYPAAISASGPEDQPLAVTLAASDVDGNPLTYSVLTQPAHGTLSGIAPNLTYTPVANYSGPDSFTFLASDGLLPSPSGTANITITPVNDAPVAVNVAATGPMEQALAVILSASDAEAGPLTFTILTQPTNGTLSGTAPNLTYTPAANFSGTDSFTYQASDGTAVSNIATVQLSISHVNRRPVANAVSASGPEDQPLAVALAGTDPDGDSLSYLIVTQPTHGTLSGTAPNLTYTPAANYFGPDSFTYRVSDGQLTSTAAATASLTITSVNDAPTATNVAATGPEDQPVTITLAGNDVDGNSLTYTVLTQPTNGTLSGTAPDLTYTPNANFSGSDSFTFRVSDGQATSASAVAILTITPVNDAPSVASSTATTDEDQPLAIVLTGNDVDGDSLTFTVLTPPAHGSLSGTAPNLTYTPTANYSGPDSFTFRASDGQVQSAAGTVSITVAPVNDAPTVADASVSTAEDQPQAILLTGNDVDGDALTYTILTPPAHGNLSGTAPNLTYTPAANYSGPDSFTFRASDAQAQSAGGTISITVTPVNDAPIAAAASFSGTEDQPLSVTLAGTDPDKDSLNYSTATQPTHGTHSGPYCLDYGECE